MMLKPFNVVLKFADIVKDAEAYEIKDGSGETLLQRLQSVDASITGINYIFGSAGYIISRIKEMCTTPEERVKLFPCIYIETTNVKTTRHPGKYAGIISISDIGIIYQAGKGTRPTQKYAEVIEPILDLVYEAFIDAIVGSGVFVLSQSQNAVKTVPHTTTDVLNERVTGLAGGAFLTVDGISIQNMELTLLSLDKLKTTAEQVEESLIENNI